MILTTEKGIRNTVEEAIENQEITDIHTHLFSPNFGDILLWDIDELLTYHYLVAEVMRWTDMDPALFWRMEEKEQAELIWQKLFVERTPVSEAARGVLTTLKEMGIDPKTKNLDTYRAEFAGRTAEAQVGAVMKQANVSNIVMTNDPFDEQERAIWLEGTRPQDAFHAVLRIDPLLNDFQNTKEKLREWGYEVQDDWNGGTIKEVNRFLEDWIEIMNPLYMAVSLPPSFAYPEESDRGRVIRDCILPVTKKHNIPFALMIGVKKRVNPDLIDAGDFVGKADIRALENLLAENQENKFLVTMLSRENQHELAVLARKFRHLMIFGCWWFMNNPVIVNEVTRMRLELLNTSFIPQHSDARVLEQVVYKWRHTKTVLKDVLTEKYEDVRSTGWPVAKEDIQKDIAAMFHENFWNFLEKDYRK
ncbi:glucuronate isomerase [Salibacterium halotolerans]|uniref:Glucuronate isomerase n=1 Tax=Salibacterium halotolerans TaxID=1884432 RepID=A0A1I5X511_9BACI|nr:glucuronate isomerase [Salibacterium halotolerans]SFQ27014.1 hypothetical protein SAMN05518683_1253 [Salibacterium halotolerans]